MRQAKVWYLQKHLFSALDAAVRVFLAGYQVSSDDQTPHEFNYERIEINKSLVVFKLNYRPEGLFVSFLDAGEIRLRERGDDVEFCIVAPPKFLWKRHEELGMLLGAQLSNDGLLLFSDKQPAVLSESGGYREKKMGWKHERAITFRGTLADLKAICKNRTELRVSQGWQRLYIEPTGIVLALPNDEGVTCNDQLDGTVRCIVMTDNDQWGQRAKALLDELSGSKGNGRTNAQPTESSAGNEQQGKANLLDSITPPKGKKRQRWIKAYSIICETRDTFQKEYNNGATVNPEPKIGDYKDALKARSLSYSERVIVAIIKYGDAGELNPT